MAGTGLWRPVPVEYKRGHSKETDADRLQLCAQAMCLEEMLCCEIPFGYLYYGETRSREEVPLSQELRQKVSDMLKEMHQYNKRQYTPKVRPAMHVHCAIYVCRNYIGRNRSVPICKTI